MPQIEKTYAAGVNRLGYRSDISPTFLPFIGRTLLRALTATVARKAVRFAPCRRSTFFELAMMNTHYSFALIFFGCLDDSEQVFQGSARSPKTCHSVYVIRFDTNIGLRFHADKDTTGQ